MVLFAATAQYITEEVEAAEEEGLLMMAFAMNDPSVSIGVFDLSFKTLVNNHCSKYLLAQHHKGELGCIEKKLGLSPQL